MLEYVALGLGATVAVAVHLHERSLENESLKIGDENKKAFERLNSELDNPENRSKLIDRMKRYEISKLISCLHNYLDLKIKAEAEF